MDYNERLEDLQGTAGYEIRNGQRIRLVTADAGEVDQAAVDKFVGEAAGMTEDERRTIANNLEAMIRRGEKAGGMSMATMIATMDALR